jgi:hypothetical protein
MRALAQDLARRALPGVLALNIAVFTAGSSSISAVSVPARQGRWVALSILLLVSIMYVTRVTVARSTLLQLCTLGGLLVALALESSVWSVDPRLTLERGGTLALVIGSAGAMAVGTNAETRELRRIVVAIIAGVLAVALAGMLLAIVDPVRALAPPYGGRPQRLQGLGQNPNTVSLLCALALPLGAWLLRAARTRAAAAGAIAGFALLLATILWSGSRGALLAGMVGLVCFMRGLFNRQPGMLRGALGAWRRRRFRVRLGLVRPLRAQWRAVSESLTGTYAVGAVAPLFATVVWLAFGGIFTAAIGAMLCVLVAFLRSGRRIVVAPAIVLLVGFGLVVQTRGLPVPTVPQLSAVTAPVSKGPTSGQAGAKPGSGGTSKPSSSQPGKAPPPGEGTPQTVPAPPLGPETFLPGRLEDELDRPQTMKQLSRLDSVLTGSGRLQAWVGAIKQGNERPLLGYGFGTEDRVFVDRFYFFQGIRPENSYIGFYLQLGVVGVLLFVAIGLLLARSFVTAVRRPPASPEHRNLTMAVGSATLAGGVIALFQSYVYSVGNIATLTFWACAFLFAAAASVPRVRPQLAPRREDSLAESSLPHLATGRRR